MNLKTFTNWAVKSFIIIALLIWANIFATAQTTWMKYDGDDINVGKIISFKSDPNLLVKTLDQIEYVYGDFDLIYSRNGMRISRDGGASFGETKLDSFAVFSVVEAPDDTNVWIASVSGLNRGKVLLSTDKGETWNVDDYLCESSAKILSIETKEIDGEYSYFGAAVNTCDGVVFSGDRFANCSHDFGLNIQTRDIKFSLSDPRSLYAASDGACSYGVCRTTDYGATWAKDSSGLSGLRILSILPSPINPQVIVCGADSITKYGESVPKGMYRSMDFGKTWEPIETAKGARVLQFALHPTQPKYVAAACDSAGVWVSANGGITWRQYSAGFPANSSVQSITIPDFEVTAEGFIAFASVIGEGVYKSPRMITSVESAPLRRRANLSIEAYPSAFSSETNVAIQTPSFSQGRIFVANTLGETIEILREGNLSNVETIAWTPRNAAPGMYFIVCETQFGSARAKVIYSK